MALNNKKPDDVPFDHDLDEYDSHYGDVPNDEELVEDGLEPELVEPETLDDSRGESELSKTKKVKTKGQQALLFALILLGALVASAMSYRIMVAKKNANTEKEDQVKTNFEKPKERTFGEQFNELPPYDPAASATASTPMPTVVSNEPIRTNTNGVVGTTPVEPPHTYPTESVSRVEPPAPTPAPTPTYVTPPTETVVAPPTEVIPLSPEEERQLRIYKSGFNVSNSRGGSTSNDVSGVAGTTPGQKSAVDPLTASLTPAGLEGSKAVRMKNRDFIITKGSMIDCVLNTKFDSSVVGMVTCTVTRNIYSASGRVVLVDRGSKVTGEYKGGLQQGQNRVFILWNRIETPKGVIIDVNSPAAGGLGEAGANGRIDSKFLKRFGGAMLVSLVNDLGKAISEAAAEKAIGGNVSLEDTSDTAQQMASAELEKSINIPPSMIKHQGDRLSIFVARDIYFGDVYDLRAK